MSPPSKSNDFRDRPRRDPEKVMDSGRGNWLPGLLVSTIRTDVATEKERQSLSLPTLRIFIPPRKPLGKILLDTTVEAVPSMIAIAISYDLDSILFSVFFFSFFSLFFFVPFFALSPHRRWSDQHCRYPLRELYDFFVVFTVKRVSELELPYGILRSTVIIQDKFLGGIFKGVVCRNERVDTKNYRGMPLEVEPSV